MGSGMSRRAQPAAASAPAAAAAPAAEGSQSHGNSSMPVQHAAHHAAAGGADPDAFICPLTHRMMVDPVVDNEGNTYERSAIENWLARSNSSPITRAHLTPSMLQPNRALRDAIEAYCQLRRDAPPAPSTVDAVSAPTHLMPVQASTEPVPEEPVQMTAKAISSLEGDGASVEICITPPQGTAAMPMDIALVVDVSGSMDIAATVDQGGEQVDVGFSVMDITKHALNTVIMSLRPIDRLCIVSFSTAAKVVMGMSEMSAENQTRAKRLVEGLSPGGTTNLWDGMRLALREVEGSRRLGAQALSSLFVLTDGIPTAHLLPPRGIIETLKNQLHKAMPPPRSSSSALLTHSNSVRAGLQAPGAPVPGAPGVSDIIPPSIYTFGFGYSLDTKLLVDIARTGKGCFSFIPDSGFVGTVFVHTLANVATSCGKYARLTLEHRPEDQVAFIGYQDVTEKISPTKSAVSLDSLTFGQTRELLVKVISPSGEECSEELQLAVEMRYCNAMGRMVGPPRVTVPLAPHAVSQTCEEESVMTAVRLEFVDAMAEMLAAFNPSVAGTPAQADLERAQAIIQHFLDKNARHNSNPRTRAILSDAEGQVAMAASQQSYWGRWGMNYVSSLMAAHRQQRCNNFKDLGVAIYGGSLFQQERDRIDEIFSDLPPPVPSHEIRSNVDGTTATSAPVVNFAAAFNSADNPCFHADAEVRLADGCLRKVSHLVKGDVLASPSAPGTARVRCVVKTSCVGGRHKMVPLNGGRCMITAWHPVEHDGKWVFPADLEACVDVACAAVYSLLLDPEAPGVVEVGGIPCVTLGHQFTDNAVVAHDYYGSSKVVEDLQSMPGFSSGLVCFRHGSIARGSDGQVLGFDSSRVILPKPADVCG